jgi:hypothetical protein
MARSAGRRIGAVPEQAKLTVVGSQHGREDTQKCGFACSVGPQQTRYAGLEPQRDAVERHCAAKPLSQFDDFDSRDHANLPR